MTSSSDQALRASAGAEVDATAVVARARELGVRGWVRPTGEMHAEGDPAAVQTLVAMLGDAATTERARVEGHEQFAVRGVSAGAFLLVATARHYELQLEVDGVMRRWVLPKGPSLDPAAKRFAVRAEGASEDATATVWDRGTYEQGGRVAWPEAIERGHAVFVLHGEKLRGGYALQRTREPQWLLIKRRDDQARPGSDIVAERPEPVR